MESTKTYTGLLVRRAQQVHVFLWQKIVSSETSSPQFGVLAALHREPGMSQANLCEELDLDRSTIADIVMRLVSRGSVKRVRHNVDKRRYELFLTDEGESEYTNLLDKVDQLDEALTHRLNEAEIAELHRLINLIVD